MKTYSMKCPNCNANLTFYDSETQVTCLYCGGTVYREEESHSEDASMVKAILDKRAELKKAQNELEALTAKREQISKQYHMPPVNEVMDNLSDGCLSFALMSFPILTLLGAIMAIGEDHDVTLFIVFLVLTAILSPLFFRGMKKWKETDKRTSKTNAKDAEARKAFEEKKKADLNAIDSEITALKNRIIDLEKESVADWLPESVRSDSNRSEKALHFIYGEMTQNKGMTLKQGQYMVFCIMGKSIAEQKYIQLANEHSGFMGWFRYNPLDHSDSTLNKAANNITRMNNLLIKYTKVYAA